MKTKNILTIKDIKNILSLNAFQKYTNIVKELGEPFVVAITNFDDGTLGGAKDLGDKYFVCISEDITEQNDVDTNFLHECLHLLQFKKGVPSVKPIDEAKQEYADKLITAFLDVPVEKKLKSWGFDNSNFINSRLENIKEHYNEYKDYMLTHHSQLNYNELPLDFGLVLDCALNISICTSEDICKLKENINSDKIIIYMAEKISKIILKTDFRQYKDIKNKINEVMEILNISKDFIVKIPNEKN